MQNQQVPSPNNEKNYRLLCAVLVERGTLRRECGKLLEGKTLDEDERKALYKALVEIAEEVAQISNPRPVYAPYSISEPAEFPPAHDPTTSTVVRRGVVPEGDSEETEGDSIGANPVPRRVHPSTSEGQGVQHRRSRSGPPVRDSILTCVSESKSIRQVDLANKIGVDIKPIYNVVNSMVADGQLVKVTKPFGPTSREVTFLEITDSGKKVLERIART